MVDKKKFLDDLQREQVAETEHQIKMRDVDSKARLQTERRALRRKIRDLELQLEEFADVASLVERLEANPVNPHKMAAFEKDHGVKEATACLLLSDLHFEESVDPSEVNNLNTFNLEIAAERCERLVIGFRWYLEMVRAKYKVRRLFVPLLGDNVTNYLHGAEDTTSNLLTPFEAVIFARQRLVEIYDALLSLDDIEEIFVPMTPGNHDRMPNSRRNPHRGRTGMSLALLLADGLAQHYKNEPRIKFELSNSAHHYTEVYGHSIRCMHGDGFRYNKGVGGIYVSARRYIAQLNSSIAAPVTLFGHHHQFKVDRDWLSNGSLIGWSAYAVNNGFSFEPAGQVAFLLDRDRGKRLPVLLQVQEGDSWA